VSALLTLDDGRTIELDQRLGSGGRSTAIDTATKKPVPDDVTREGSIDATRLLGLSRETAVATLFARQADMLRVLTDAEALQEYLERAAATTSIDTTADEALARIAAYKRDHVGLLRSGSRGPLAVATRTLERARATLDEAHDHYERYQQLMARRRDADSSVEAAERELGRLNSHEQRRLQIEEWREIRAIERRLDQARRLEQQMESDKSAPHPDRELSERIVRALTQYETRPEVPAPLEGPTVGDLEAELAALPTIPHGDLEPNADIGSRRDELHARRQRHSSHLANAPEEPALEADEGDSAASLEGEIVKLPVTPHGDLEPAADVTAARDRWHGDAQRLAGQDANRPKQPAPIADGEAETDTAEGLELQLAQLPSVPTGDVEPSPEVTERLSVWRRTTERLLAHASTKPSIDTTPVPIASSEMRRLADELEAVVPAVDESLRAQVERRRRASPHVTFDTGSRPAGPHAPASRSPRIAIGVGAGIVVLGVVLVALGAAIPGLSGVLLGVSSVVVGLVLRTRPKRSPIAASPTSSSTADVELPRLEARLLLEEESAAQSHRRRESALTRVQELQLPTTADGLRRLAGTTDSLHHELEWLSEWERRRGELEAACVAAESELREALAAHGTVSDIGQDLDDAYRQYVDACRERARQAGQAARRADLEARLEQRRAADAARQAELDRCVEWERRRGELEAASVAAESELREALAAHGTVPDEGEDVDRTYQRYVEACRQRAGQASQAGRKDDLLGRLNERRSAEDARAKELAARTTAEELLAAMATEAGYPSPGSSIAEEVEPQLRAWLTTNETREVEHRKHEETIARLDQVLDNQSSDELAAVVAERVAAAGPPPSDDDEYLDDQSGAVQRQRQEVRRARDHVAELAGQIEVAGSQLLDVSVAIEGEARAEAEVSRITTLAEDLDRASAILEAAQQKVHADIAPVLNATVRPWVPRITQARYDDIRVDPATLEIEVREVSSGQYRTATVLSHGTTEQLFLLLRLALAQHLATTGETAPIVLDDVTVQSDAARTRAILDLLYDLSRERQVVFFSQEEEVLAWAEKRLAEPDGRLIRLSPAR
jgi:hypothetical protein